MTEYTDVGAGYLVTDGDLCLQDSALVAAMKITTEEQRRIEALESRVTELLDRIEQLEHRVSELESPL